MMNLPVICIMLLTPNTIINQLTKNANRFSPTTTLASSLKINDNDILHHPLTEATITTNITPLIPPQQGEKFYELSRKQLGQTAAIRPMPDINAPEKLHYGTVSSASHQPELNDYAFETQQMNENTTYPHGEDTEGGVSKEGDTPPFIAKKIEPPERFTSIINNTTCATIISKASEGHYGEETEGVERFKFAVPFLRRPIKPPERGVLLQIQFRLQCPLQRLLQRLLWLLQRLLQFSLQLLRLLLLLLRSVSIASFYSLVQPTPPTVNAKSNFLLAPHNHMKPARVTGACKTSEELLPIFSDAMNTGNATTCPRPAPFDGVGARTDE